MALSYYVLHINFGFGSFFPFEYHKLYKLTQLTHVFHHNVILHQNSLGHNCRHLQAIEVTLWSLEQPFLGPCNHLSEFIRRPCLLPSSAFCTIQSILFLNYSTSNYSLMFIINGPLRAYIFKVSLGFYLEFKGSVSYMHIIFSTC